MSEQSRRHQGNEALQETVVSLLRRQNQILPSVTVQTLLKTSTIVASSFMRYKPLRLLHQQKDHPVGATRECTEQLD